MKKLRMVTMAVLGLAAAAVLAVVPSETYKTDFTGNGSTKAFAYTFKTLSASWVAVYFGSTKQTSGFTVAVNANQDSSPGGTVTFTTAPPTATEIHIQRAAPLKQESAWPPATPFRAKTLETQLDTQVMQLQQVDGRTTQLCEQVDQVMSLAQGPMGPKGADGSISNITQNLDFISTYKGINVIDPTNAQDIATKHYVDTLPAVTALTANTGQHWQMPGSEFPIFWKMSGVCHLEGLVQNDGNVATGSFATMPSGYRPIYNVKFRAYALGQTGYQGHVSVNTAGNLYCWQSDGSTVNGYGCSLDGISFRCQ